MDTRLYLPQEWTQDPERCDEAQVPLEQREYRSQNELALHMLQQARAWGHLTADWVTGDDEFGKSPTFRDGVAAGRLAVRAGSAREYAGVAGDADLGNPAFYQPGPSAPAASGSQ